jgi:pimeloyl-ACP methyl ester carboxylesterase
MKILSADGLDIEYETFGVSTDPSVLLVMGLGAQLIHWDASFCEQIAASGKYVIRFDNRDSGLSSKCEGSEVDLEALLNAFFVGGDLPEVPYTLSDMANDAFGLLDALGIEKAHVVGASLGGMIAQTMAIERPNRLLSLTSMMSTTGNPDNFEIDDEAFTLLLTPSPSSRSDYIEHAAAYEVWSSKKYFDLKRAKEVAAVTYDRSNYPDGVVRQLAAAVASGSREAELERLMIPTLVIHGRDDRLIGPSSGFRTAELIPGSSLLLLSDMGHDLPRQLWPMIIGVLEVHFARSGKFDVG